MHQGEQAAKRRVVIAGSTGSIGTQAIDVITHNHDAFTVSCLAATDRHIDLLARQTLLLGPEAVAIATSNGGQAAQAFHDAYTALARTWHKEIPEGHDATRRQTATHRTPPRPPRVLTGADALTQAAAWPCDVVLNAVAGAAGLPVTLTTLRSGGTLALANKESLVMGGPLVTALAQPGQIVPVDSEHAAIAHCLRAGSGDQVRRLILTCSGGPFRGYTPAQLSQVTPAQALAHPTWSMGPGNTLNSATLVNKGLEIIEAHFLFGVPLDRISVTVHPQSVVHSMVEYVDGTTLAALSPPDMRLPIAQALAWPGRLPDIAPAVDWTNAHTWTFHPLREEAHPAVWLARQAAAAGGTHPAVYNAAAEQATALFLDSAIGFPAITDLLARTIAAHHPPSSQIVTLEDVQTADTWARAHTRRLATGAPEPGRAQEYTDTRTTSPSPEPDMTPGRVA